MPNNLLLVRVWALLMAFAPKGLFSFLTVGLLGLATDLAVLWFVERLGFGKAVARAVSLSVATLVTWSLNRRLTFAASQRKPVGELVRYSVVALLAQGLNYIVFLEVLRFKPKLSHSLAAILGAVVATIFSYSGQRFFTFLPGRVERDA
jgi:putative flippase GtrA